MKESKKTKNNSTGRVTVDDARVDRMKSLFLSTPLTIDHERVIFMKKIYEDNAGYQQIIQRAKFLEYLLDNKKIYIDENLIVGSMANCVNAYLTFPEWSVEWMKQDKVIENCKTKEEREANEWAIEYWGRRSLKKRTDEIFIKKYGYDPNIAERAGLFQDFASWPGGGGNLNYPKIYNQGIASVIKDIEERQAALDVRLDAAPKLYFYEASLIILRAAVRYANRYAKLAREMAGKEKNEIRKEELLAIAETCEWVPEQPARNLREAVQAHFFAHIVAELEQIGCGYSEAYLGQNLEPYYQADKAAGLLDAEGATFILKNLFIKLNEIQYWYGTAISTYNSSDLGQSITLGGFTDKEDDATAEMDYLILDASSYLKLPQPPLSCMYHNKLKGKFLEKVLDTIGTGIGMPQFVNGEVAVKRALNIWGDRITLEQARRTAVGACVGTFPPYETGHPVEGQTNSAKALEFALNNGVNPASGIQVGPKTGDPETFKTFEELYEAFTKQLDFMMLTCRKHSMIANILCAEFLPCAWRSILTNGCIERGTEVWNGGANVYSVGMLVMTGVDAANGLLAVKQLIYDDKKLTWPKLKAALAADFEGEYEPIRKMCLDAPKHGNDIDEVNKFVRRVYDDIYNAFQKVGGNFISKDIKSTPDCYTKSSHNSFGLVTGALPTGKKNRVALSDGSMSAMPGTDVNGPTALAASGAKSIDAVQFTSSHMNMKLPPDQLQTRKGRETVLNLVMGFMDLGGGHIQFSVLNTDTLRDAQKHPENYRDLVVRVAGFCAFFTKLHPGVQDEIIRRTEQEFGMCGARKNLD
ncbi:MAG: pyruvate formate lyase family protein [Desulfobacterales bacterium]